MKKKADHPANAGELLLLPAALGTEGLDAIPQSAREAINTMDGFIVEKERSARRYLIQLGIERPIDHLQLLPMNKRTGEAERMAYLRKLLAGERLAILSEAGSPAIADPGSSLVALAHQNRIRVRPLAGPSSIFLALMASGMNGQRFAFWGYLHIQSQQRCKELRQLESFSRRHSQTQIFIETPYRNRQLLEDILKTCHPKTEFCIAANLTLPQEYIRTQPIGQWQGHIPNIHKQPAVFLIYNPGGR